MGGDGIANRTVFTPVDKGPSQPDLTQDARKMELSDATSGQRLPSPIFMPAALYQKVNEGEQPVAFSEKGMPAQAVTIFTACVGAEGSDVTFKLTSLEPSIQVPFGKVTCRANAFSLAPWREGTAISESTGRRLSVQE
jgi:hypothetical protein